MPSIEFDPSKKKLLFFCRGRGSGHAIPDIEIVRELHALRNDVDVRFVSYATGAKTLANFGFTVIDLDLPELNSLLDTIVLASKVTGWLDPDLIVSHEEFGALPASKIYDKPAIFITDWFVENTRMTMQTLRYAESVLFIDEPGFFEEPTVVERRVNYVGPIMRNFEYAPADRERARTELGIPTDAVVISVLPGSYANEERVPIADLVIGAFQQLQAPSKNLLWVAGADEQLLLEKSQNCEGLLVRGYEWQIDRVMTASDVAITKANRKTVLELESLGIPSIAISPATNPIDDARVSACAGVRFRRHSELNVESLLGDIKDLLSQPKPPPTSPSSANGARLAARQISNALDSAQESDE